MLRGVIVRDRYDDKDQWALNIVQYQDDVHGRAEG